jgi:hypothetical protein
MNGNTDQLPMTPARKALLAYAKAWTYPVLGNEDGRVVDRLFEEARELANAAATRLDDPPNFAEWLATLKAHPNLDAWEDTLFAVTDYFGLSAVK